MDINFASYYRPVQGENLWPERVRESLIYKEFMPCSELQPFVACFWAVNSLKPINEPVIDRIIPDGCMDIVFNMEDLSLGKDGLVVGIMVNQR